MIIHYIMDKSIFFRCFLLAFTTEEALEFHITDFFKMKGKQMIKIPKNG